MSKHKPDSAKQIHIRIIHRQVYEHGSRRAVDPEVVLEFFQDRLGFVSTSREILHVATSVVIGHVTAMVGGGLWRRVGPTGLNGKRGWNISYTYMRVLNLYIIYNDSNIIQIGKISKEWVNIWNCICNY